jgi:competence transcription factor ComK
MASTNIENFIIFKRKIYKFEQAFIIKELKATKNEKTRLVFIFFHSRLEHKMLHSIKQQTKNTKKMLPRAIPELQSVAMIYPRHEGI